METRIWRWLVPLIVLALAVGAGFALLIGKAMHDDLGRQRAAGEAPAGQVGCEVVQLAFDDDQTMGLVARQLEQDPQVHRLFPETKAEAYARFRKVFKDDPEVLGTVTADSMPALLTVVPERDADPKALAAQWGRRYTSPDNAKTLPARGLPAAWRPAGC